MRSIRTAARVRRGPDGLRRGAEHRHRIGQRRQPCRVRADGCRTPHRLGTGTSIGDGLVVTAAHVVAGAAQVEVTRPAWHDCSRRRGVVRPRTGRGGTPPDLRTHRSRRRFVVVRARRRRRVSIAMWSTDELDRIAGASTSCNASPILTTDIYRDADVERPGLRVTATVEPGDSGAWCTSPRVVPASSGAAAPNEQIRRGPSMCRRYSCARSCDRNSSEPVDTGPCP